MNRNNKIRKNTNNDNVNTNIINGTLITHFNIVEIYIMSKQQSLVKSAVHVTERTSQSDSTKGAGRADSL